MQLNFNVFGDAKLSEKTLSNWLEAHKKKYQLAKEGGRDPVAATRTRWRHPSTLPTDLVQEIEELLIREVDRGAVSVRGGHWEGIVMVPAHPGPTISLTFPLLPTADQRMDLRISVLKPLLPLFLAAAFMALLRRVMGAPSARGRDASGALAEVLFWLRQRCFRHYYYYFFPFANQVALFV